MSLSKYEPCDPNHKTELEYCCMRSNRVYCQLCWFKEGHPYRCFSSKCGHFQKIAHLVIDRTLEMKLMHATAQLSSSHEKFDTFYRSFYRFKEAITQKIKTDVENKLPLFLWSAIIEMVTSRNPKLGGLSFEQSTCSDMLKIIKGKEQSKVQSLSQACRCLEKVTHSYQGLQNKLKGRTYTGQSDGEVEGIINFISHQGNPLIFNLGTSLKKHMQSEVKKLLEQFDPAIQFDGIRFNNKKNFENVESYNVPGLSASLLPDLSQGQGSLYHGIRLQMQKLQQCPEILMEAGKSMLKEKIFQIHSNIKEIKSLYPYKYGYVMSTCLQPDPDYEFLMLGLEKQNIKTYQKKSESSFLNSINLVIMGPELITVEFRNYPRKMTEICIFGYADSREKHYNEIIEVHLGLGKEKTDKAELRKVNKYPFQSKLTRPELVYVQFELAYEHLFTDKEKRADFEGERYALGRGIRLFDELVRVWKTTAEIEFPIEKEMSELTQLFI